MSESNAKATGDRSDHDKTCSVSEFPVIQDTYTDFLSRWHVAELPFCPTGMRLLHAMAEHRPDLFEHARQGGFADFSDPAFAGSVEAQALKLHYDSCEECQVC